MWLFSRRVDLAVFGGSALLSLLLLWIGAAAGFTGAGGQSPEWSWVATVLLIDVAHVWSTGFRVYADVDELRRRPWLYAAVPLCGWGAGILLYAQGALTFWRALAYLAVFHFVRQQRGWVVLYRARAGERDRAGALLDAAAVYMAAIYPLLWWHAHLPRRFAWFVDGDFAALPALAVTVARPIWLALLLGYAARSLWRGVRAGRWNPGKDLVVASTALLWWLGIVAFDSDYAFTVTNVVIHGVPYFALVWWTARHRGVLGRGSVWWFLGMVWMLAYVEELLWDGAVWHERGWLFGPTWDASAWHGVLVPLLVVPQLTHYVLDAFIWRRRSNPALAGLFSAGAAMPTPPPARSS